MLRASPPLFKLREVIDGSPLCSIVAAACYTLVIRATRPVRLATQQFLRDNLLENIPRIISPLPFIFRPHVVTTLPPLPPLPLHFDFRVCGYILTSAFAATFALPPLPLHFDFRFCRYILPVGTASSPFFTCSNSALFPGCFVPERAWELL